MATWSLLGIWSLTEILLGTLIGGLLLRASIGIFNMLVGGNRVIEEELDEKFQETVQNAVVADNQNPFAAPQTVAKRKIQTTTTGIPMPSFISAMGIIFLTVLSSMALNFAFSFVMTLVAPLDSSQETSPSGLATQLSIFVWVSGIFYVASRFLLLTIFTTLLTPTKFVRAIFVSIIFAVIVTLFVVLVGGFLGVFLTFAG